MIWLSLKIPLTKDFLFSFFLLKCYSGDSVCIHRYKVRVEYIAADLSNSSNIELLWSEVIKLYPDGVDILINNAGLRTTGVS